jgi:hypothetical protein
LTCSPGSLASFKPAINASAESAGGCTAKVIGEIIYACYAPLADASATACNDLLTSSSAALTCFQGCLETPWTAASPDLTYSTTPWGATWFVEWGSGVNAGLSVNVNIGGCYAAAAPTDKTAQKCAKDLEEGQECYLQACATNCPVTCDPATDATCTASSSAYTSSVTAFNACASATISGECATYFTAANTDCASLTGSDGGPIGQCNDAINVLFSSTTPTHTDLVRAWTELFTVVCGPAAGTD